MVYRENLGSEEGCTRSLFRLQQAGDALQTSKTFGCHAVGMVLQTVRSRGGLQSLCGTDSLPSTFCNALGRGLGLPELWWMEGVFSGSHRKSTLLSPCTAKGPSARFIQYSFTHAPCIFLEQVKESNWAQMESSHNVYSFPAIVVVGEMVRTEGPQAVCYSYVLLSYWDSSRHLLISSSRLRPERKQRISMKRQHTLEH